jgi:hypothetical protein
MGKGPTEGVESDDVVTVSSLVEAELLKHIAQLRTVRATEVGRAAVR